MNQRKKWMVGLGIGCGVAAIVCIAVAVVVLVGGGLLVKWGLQEPENVHIDVSAPVQVTKGEAVVIQVQVENVAAESQLLDSIDISTEYLAGIAIQEAEPPFVESYPLSFGLEQQSYTFRQQIPPGSTLVVQLFGTAVQAGDFSGEIDVCINTGSSCAGFSTRTIVEE